jgi:hypothetical protein
MDPRNMRRAGLWLATALVCFSALVSTASAALTFGPPTNFGAGSAPGSVATGDLNGDGVPDHAVANGASDNV